MFKKKIYDKQDGVFCASTTSTFLGQLKDFSKNAQILF